MSISYLNFLQCQYTLIGVGARAKSLCRGRGGGAAASQTCFGRSLTDCASTLNLATPFNTRLVGGRYFTIFLVARPREATSPGLVAQTVSLTRAMQISLHTGLCSSMLPIRRSNGSRRVSPSSAGRAGRTGEIDLYRIFALHVSV